MSMTVADKIVDMMEEAGIKRLYAIVGDSLNQIANSVSKSNIEWIGVRHEETGAFAAGGEAFVSGELCACAGTAGPGSIHLINGLYEANENHLPLLAIVTHIPSNQFGLNYFQSYQPMLAFKDCSVFCEMISSPEQMPKLLQAAMQTAVAKSGVAVIIIPGDVASQEYTKKTPNNSIIKQKPVLTPELNALDRAAHIINNSNKVCIYCGFGARECFDRVLELAEKINAPIVWTLRSKFFAQVNNPFSVGINGLLANGSSKYALENADCLILLATDFPFSQALPNTKKVIQIDNCGDHLGRRSKIDAAVLGDIDAALYGLSPQIMSKGSNQYLKASLDYAKEIEKQEEINLKKMYQEKVLRPELLTKTISDLADSDAIFIVDVGLNDLWAARYIKPRSGQIIFGSFRHGTMGAGLGQAIGMSLYNRNRQVIYLAGDGNLGMFLGDLMTIKKYNLPIKIIVYNNKELGFINLEAKYVGIEPFATELDNPDFAKIAEAMGIANIKIHHNNQLIDSLTQVMNSTESFLVDAYTNPQAIGQTFGVTK